MRQISAEDADKLIKPYVDHISEKESQDMEAQDEISKILDDHGGQVFAPTQLDPYHISQPRRDYIKGKRGEKVPLKVVSEMGKIDKEKVQKLKRKEAYDLVKPETSIKQLFENVVH